MDKDSHLLYFALFNEIGIIGQLSRALMESRLPDGITLPHFSVLNHLVRVQDGRTPLDLARAFQVPKTSMTNTIAGLEDRGLIKIRLNPNDARSKCVWLSAKGRRFRESAIRLLDNDMDDIADRIPLEKIKILLPHLKVLREVMDKKRGD